MADGGWRMADGGWRMADGGRVKSREKRLLGVFGRLAPEQQEKLLAFAELLADDPSPGARVDLPRPAGEGVATAIRRLARSYPMLDRRKLMGEASRLMAQHALEGRPAAEVIDELEALFERHYQQLKSKAGSRKTKG
jgi:hypothetical protein